MRWSLRNHVTDVVGRPNRVTEMVYRPGSSLGEGTHMNLNLIPRPPGLSEEHRQGN